MNSITVSGVVRDIREHSKGNGMGFQLIELKRAGTSYWRCSAFDRSARWMREYVTDGVPVIVSGYQSQKRVELPCASCNELQPRRLWDITVTLIGFPARGDIPTYCEEEVVSD